MPDPTSFSLTGKVIVQCGASGLLGRAFVHALGQAGANLVLATRSRAGVAASIEAGAAAGHTVSAEEVDIADEASVAALCDRVRAAHGRIDGLVFNAVSRPMGTAKTQLEGWRESMRVNATGFYITLQAFAEAMAAQPEGGSIVNIASMMGMIGPNPWLYEGTGMSASPDYFFHKGGMINVTRYYASMFGPRKVRVNVVSPGGIYNPEKPQADAFLAKYNKMTMLGRMGDAPEICGAAVFLLSDAATYVTGANIPVDGGYTAK